MLLENGYIIEENGSKLGKMEAKTRITEDIEPQMMVGYRNTEATPKSQRATDKKEGRGKLYFVKITVNNIVI